MELQLTDKHVFIAGASRGIGRAMAEAFLGEGAKVTLTGRGKASLDEAKGALTARFGAERIFASSGDMTDTAVLAAALDGAEAALGPVHTLVCNVGIDSAPPGFDVSDETWEAGIAQNFLGSVRLAREALKRVSPAPGRKPRRLQHHLHFVDRRLRGAGHAADLWRVQGRAQPCRQGTGEDHRPRRHPRQRHRAGQYRLSRRRLGTTPGRPGRCLEQMDAARSGAETFRQARRDRRCGAVSGQPARQLRHRPCAGGRWRAVEIGRPSPCPLPRWGERVSTGVTPPPWPARSGCRRFRPSRPCRAAACWA